MKTIRVVMDITVVDLPESNRVHYAEMSGMSVDELESVDDTDPEELGATIAGFIARSTDETLEGSDLMIDIKDAVFVSAKDISPINTPA